MVGVGVHIPSQSFLSPLLIIIQRKSRKLFISQITHFRHEVVRYLSLKNSQNAGRVLAHTNLAGGLVLEVDHYIGYSGSFRK